MSNSNAPAMPSRRLQAVVCGVLALSLTGLDLSVPLSWPTALLVLMAALKLREAVGIPERRLVALLQLLALGLVTAQQTGLLASAFELLIAIASLAGLLQLELGLGLRWRQLLRRSGQLLVAALPVALVLFLLVPRFGPIWNLPRRTGAAAQTGLSEQLDPGRIATLADSAAVAARVAFSDNRPPPQEERYWRVMTHERFDGNSWQRNGLGMLIAWNSNAAATTADREKRQLWLMQAQGFDAVPWDGRAAPIGADLRLRSNGELVWRGGDGRSYALQSRNGPAPWQAIAPTRQELTLPSGSQPRLEALARTWAALPEPAERLNAAADWFRAQPFRYSRSPGQLPERHGLDVFLFERRLGFCGHYASAFSALMRAAGVPARVVSGYRGGTWVQPLGGAPYLEIRERDAHAWAEIWLPQTGWIDVDPSSWAAGDNGSSSSASPRAGEGWWRWGQRQWWGLDMAWSRWWLGFDRDQQAGLMEQLLGTNRNWLGLWILLAVAGSQGLVLVVLWINQRRGGARRRTTGVRERALKACLAELLKLGLKPAPGEALEDFCQRVVTLHPELRSNLQQFCRDHQHLLYRDEGQPASASWREHKRLQSSVQRISSICQSNLQRRSGSPQTSDG